MPSWNVHTAHVERLLTEYESGRLGIADENAFLFGNYVPDIYLGFMVPDAGFRIDYCITHRADLNRIPLPDADAFWDDYVYRRRPASPVGVSLVLGAWAHLLTDRLYNRRFRAFCKTHEVPSGEELRIRKQADFDLFGHSLCVSTCVHETIELVEAAEKFRPYSVLPDDVTKTIGVATSIVRGNDKMQEEFDYKLLSARWMNEVFDECDSLLKRWLSTWQRLEHRDGRAVSAADIRSELG